MNTNRNYSIIPSTAWFNSVYFCWTVLPVLAHWLSWMTGVFGYILFPVLVTIAQYFIFKIHPATDRATPWFFTLPITFFIWAKWGPFATDMQSHIIMPGVIAYYAGQLLNTLFLPLVIRPDQRILIVNWLGSNVVALTVWVILLNTLSRIIPDWQGDHSSSYSTVLTTYPIIGLLANGTSGFFFAKRLWID